MTFHLLGLQELFWNSGIFNSTTMLIYCPIVLHWIV